MTIIAIHDAQGKKNLCGPQARINFFYLVHLRQTCPSSWKDLFGSKRGLLIELSIS